MTVVAILLPVFFMLALGFASRQLGWVTRDQKDAVNGFLFNILFPVLIFNLMATASIDASVVPVVGYILLMFLVALFVIGPLTARFTGRENAHFSKYLLTTCEGANVALPLYLSIVGASSNTVIFDLASTVMAFVVVPIMVAREAASGSSAGDLIKGIFTNSFVIAVILGLLLNLTGLYGAIVASPFGDAWTSTISMVTSPIVALILFCLGFDLTVDKSTLGPILKLGAVRFGWCAIIILGFFLLFGSRMADKEYLIAVLLYFTCPTGFGLAPMLTPLYRKKEEPGFTSAFMSLYIIVTLVVYTLVVVFLA